MVKVALHQRLSGFCLAYEMREKRKGRGGQRGGRSRGGGVRLGTEWHEGRQRVSLPPSIRSQGEPCWPGTVSVSNANC